MVKSRFIEDHCVDEDTIFTLGNFTVLWAQFELNYCDKFASPKKIHDMMNDFEPDKKLCSLCEIIRVSALDYIGNYDEYTMSQRIYSSTNGGRPEYIARIKSFIEDGEMDFDGCMLFIERIRNNLLHGEKDIYTLPVQKKMFNAINSLLDEILMNRICL